MKKLRILIIIFIAIASINVHASEKAKNGWVVVNGQEYFYENNEKVTGFHTINQNDYYFNENGELQTGGLKEIDGKMYFLGIYTGKIMKGWFNDYEGRTFHSDPNTGELSHLWTDIDGKTYFFGIKTYKLMKGFLTLEDGVYYLDRTTGERKTGMIQDGNNTYYFNPEDGKKTGGKYTINGQDYYFNGNGELQKSGIIELNGKMYYLSMKTGKVMKGWFTDSEGRTFHSDPNTGELSHLWTEIDGKTYFFGIKTYKLMKGFLTLEDGVYYLDKTTGERKTGMIQEGNTAYYFGTDDGKRTGGRYTINGNEYFFNSNGELQKGGLREIDGKMYFLGIYTGKIMKGWFNDYEGRTFHSDTTTGELSHLWEDIDGKTYFFGIKTYKLMKGLLTLENGVYYLNTTTGVKESGKKKIGNNDYYFNKDTYLLEKVQYNPVYYSQKDSNWQNIQYGFSTLGKTGCAPTSMAMAFESILNRRVLPTEVADYLYYQTSEYNRYTIGSSGLAIIYATDYFNIKRTGISSLEQLNQELEKGKIVFAAMGNGKFATPTWNHAILLYNHTGDNMTYALDPLTDKNNGWIETYRIWNEQSTDPDDKRGGYIFYALERN